jgi:hypothetical protein
VTRYCRFWLSKLYEALFPVHYQVGSPWTSQLAQSPETTEAIGVVKEWLRETLYDISPWTFQGPVVTAFMQAVTLAFLFDPKSAQEYLVRTQCITTLPPKSFIRSRMGDSIFVDILRAFEGFESSAALQSVLSARYASLTSVLANST